MGTCEAGHGPGMRIRAALPGSGDPDPRRRQALAVLEDEACRIPFWKVGGACQNWRAPLAGSAKMR